MELIVLIGIPGSGKSTFYRERYVDTHVRLNLDMLRTRHRERRLLETCLEVGQRVLVDNTNPTAADRARYLAPARARGFRLEGFYFRSVAAECVARNAQRHGPARIPEAAVRGVAGKLELPRYAEGFDALWYVELGEGGFLVAPWQEPA